MSGISVYGIGNPLIDAIIRCGDEEVAGFSLTKGTMNLVEPTRVEELLASLKGREITYSPGGSCPNTMIALSGLGTKTAFSGAVGSDELGKIYEEQLKTFGVLSCITVHPGATGTSLIMVTPDAERTMNTHLGVCGCLGTSHIDADRIAEADFLYFTGYMWDTENQKEAVKAALGHARRNGTRVVFDLADPLVVERNREAFLSLLEDHVDIALANRSEGELLFGKKDPKASAEELRKFVSLAVIKNGAEGSLIAADEGECLEIPAAAASPVDTIGAGDIYAAGFLHGLSKGMDPRKAGALASFAAARIIEQPGARFSKETLTRIRNEGV